MTRNNLMVLPDGWPCTLANCPPGLFVYNGTLVVKTEYGGDPPYLAQSGEVFWGGTTTAEDRAKLIVQPCVHQWEKDEG